MNAKGREIERERCKEGKKSATFAFNQFASLFSLSRGCVYYVCVRETVVDTVIRPQCSVCTLCVCKLGGTHNSNDPMVAMNVAMDVAHASHSLYIYIESVFMAYI